MASLNKLASMDGWDIDGDEPDDESTGPSASDTRPRCVLEDDIEKQKDGNNGKQEDDIGRQHERGEQRAIPKGQLEQRNLGEILLRGDDGAAQSPTSSVNPTPETTVPRSAFFRASCKERAEAQVDAGGLCDYGEQDLLVPDDSRAGQSPGKDGTRPATWSESSSREDARGLYSPRKRHPLDTLRTRVFGSDSGSRSGGNNSGDGSIAGGGANEAIVANLKASLRREREKREQEREGREVFEEKARGAFASFEAESKRALELENRVRVLTMRISLSGKNGGGEAGSESPEYPCDHWRRARSLSPVSRGRLGARAAVNAEKDERHAQMAVISDATDTAREEAQAALDVVEGFASLNRKLVGELRIAIRTRDDLLKVLRVERTLREELEGQLNELLGGGLAAALKDTEEEFNNRYEQEREETARVVALHSRMEEEYSLALGSSGRERVRLEQAVKDLEEELRDEHRARAVRASQEEERATMGSEEVGSIRAGLAPRSKRRGNDPNSRFPGRRGGGGGGHGRSGGGGGSGGGGWLEAQQARIETQQRVTAVGRKKEQPPTNIPNNVDRGRSDVKASAVSGPFNRSFGRGSNQLKTDVVRGAAAPNAAIASGFIARTGRLAPPSPSSRSGGASVGIGGASKGDGDVGLAVHAAAVECVERFLGDFVPKAREPKPRAVDTEVREGGGSDGGGSPVKKVSPKASRWAAIGRGGKLSARTTAICAEEAAKAAEAEAHVRLRSLVDGSARVLSASWLSIVWRTTAKSPATGGGGGGGGFSSDAQHADVSVDATVPVIVVRRLMQTCGMLRSGAGGPTLAHVDMEIQRNTVGKGRLGHREYFNIILSLSQSRFDGEAKDAALDKLARMLHPVQAGSGSTLHARSRQTKDPVPSAARSTASAETRPPTSLEGAGAEEGLGGAERVLERDRRALESIFLHYSDGCLSAPDTPGGRRQQLLPFAAIMSFCKDFELSPGLISREDAHTFYVQLVYPHETLLTPKLVATREGFQGRKGAGRTGGGARDAGDQGGSGLGLALGGWMAWLGLAAIGCAWFDKQRGLYNTPTKKVLGLLQWMESSAGKTRISSKRGGAVIPAFNLLPP